MSSRSRYSIVAISMHWLIAVLILANLALGWRMGFLDGLEKFTFFQLHKSIGISVLVLSVLRLGWRLLNPSPPLPAGMTHWERRLASTTHRA
ncbi:MAG: cytochrome b, partial [Sphingomonadaceae bacterium]